MTETALVIGCEAVARRCAEAQAVTTSTTTRRAALGTLGGFAATAASIAMLSPARAATHVRFQTSWFAQAEHGGFYQAKATGLYERAGLDVDVLQGGPQINNAQLLVGGDTDFIMGYDIQTLENVEKGVPMISVAPSFQFELQCIVAHPNINSLADLKGHTILAAVSSHSTWWPWLKQKFGYTDEMSQPYNFTYQRFESDPMIAQQGFITYDPFAMEKEHIPAKFFLLADDGYPAYGSPIVTTQDYVQKNRDVTQRFVAASLEGWKSYLNNPAPANALIKAANPKMLDDQIAFAIGKLRAIKALSGGDAATLGIGTMTDARWKRTRDFLVQAQLLKEGTDWHSAYTTDFVKRSHIG